MLQACQVASNATLEQGNGAPLCIHSDSVIQSLIHGNLNRGVSVQDLLPVRSDLLGNIGIASDRLVKGPDYTL